MRQIPEKELDIFEMELAVKWAHAASLMDTNPEVSYMFALSETALKEKLERLKSHQPSNEPLTPEQIREMDGEPVWIETADIKKANRWAFVDVGCEIVRFFDTRCGVKCTVMGNHFRTYGKTWLAYRRKPEAPANAE